MTLRHRLKRHSLVGPGQSAKTCWDLLARRFQGTIPETQGETGLPTSPKVSLRARKGREVRQAGMLNRVGPGSAHAVQRLEGSTCERTLPEPLDRHKSTWQHILVRETSLNWHMPTWVQIRSQTQSSEICHSGSCSLTSQISTSYLPSHCSQVRTNVNESPSAPKALQRAISPERSLTWFPSSLSGNWMFTSCSKRIWVITAPFLPMILGWYLGSTVTLSLKLLKACG